MNVHFDPLALRRLLERSDGVFLGVIEQSTGRVELFRAGRSKDDLEPEFAGHADLIRSGQVPESGYWGFSLHVTAGRVAVFYRNSVLNLNLPLFSLPVETMDTILLEAGIELAEDFRSYP